MTPPASLPPTGSPAAPAPDFDLDDAWLRAAGNAKWTFPAEGVLPAWIAEMDVRPCPAILDAVADALARGLTGYPDLSRSSGLAPATAAFLGRRFGWEVAERAVVVTGDVMAGVRIALEELCKAAPVVVPVPTYPPFLDVVPLAGLQLVPVRLTRDGDGRFGLDLDAIDDALRAGARTVLLSSPHNPTGRVFEVEELQGLRDVVARHGARVVSDEIHAPLVLEPGRRHVPFASLDGAAELTVTVLAASKAWNVPGLKCAQLVATAEADVRALRRLPHVANAGTSPLGIVATVAAYTDGLGWLDGVREHLTRRRDQFGELLERLLPGVAWTPPEATYLAWLDVSAHARENGWDAAEAALRGGVMLSRGPDFGADGRWARLNLATSAERLERIVGRLAAAWV